MSIRLFTAFLIAVALAACSTEEPSVTTTTEASGVTDPSTSAPATTRTSTTTTTTVPATTTTVAPTTTLGGGGWADVPVIASAWGVMGWWDGEAWVAAEEGVDLTGRYRLLGPEGEEEAVADTVGEYCGVESGGVVARPELLWGDFDPFPDWSVALSAPWDLGETEILDNQADEYVEYVADHLSQSGLEVDAPQLVQVIRADLSGNGVDEVIVVAESIAQSPALFASEGDYSVALVRMVVDGEVQTAVLDEWVVADLEEGEIPFIVSLRVPAVADLNGDGTMEVVMSGAYYEGSGIQVFDYLDDDLGFSQVLVAGCGV